MGMLEKCLSSLFRLLNLPVEALAYKQSAPTNRTGPFPPLLPPATATEDDVDNEDDKVDDEDEDGATLIRWMQAVQ